MNVLSLFDGMSCGQIALERVGIKVDNYYASEIDKYAIKVTQKNYPNTVQLGDVTNVSWFGLPKIDLMYGGSPCQSFSFAGRKKGMSTKDNIEITSLEQYLKLKEEGFEFEGQSYLFWEYMRILKIVQPKYFLLENVLMPKKWEEILSKNIGVEPILLNSNKVSCQDRKRLYWTNIPFLNDIEDKNIYLKDIQEFNIERRVKSSLHEYYNEKYHDNHNTNNGVIKVFDGVKQGYFKSSFSQNRIFSSEGKCPTLTTDCEINVLEFNGRMSVIECERAQTVPDNYTEGVSNTQRYKMLGNGWTVDVIAHIFKGLKNE